MIIDFNYRLKTLSETENFYFLWNVGDFLAREGFPSHLFVKDKYHLNARGLGVLLRGFRSVIGENSELRAPERRAPERRAVPVPERRAAPAPERRAAPVPERRAAPALERRADQHRLPHTESQGDFSLTPTLEDTSHYPPLPERQGYNPTQRLSDQPITPHLNIPCTTPASASADESIVTQSQTVESRPLPSPPINRRILPPYLDRHIHAHQMMMRGYYPNFTQYPYAHFPLPPVFAHPQPFPHGL